MKIIEQRENGKVMILRNKRKGLKLLAIKETILIKCSDCCYLWNKQLCNEKPCGKVGIGAWGSYHFIKDED